MTYDEVIQRFSILTEVFSGDYDRCILGISNKYAYPTFIIEYYIDKSESCHKFTILDIPALPNDDNIYPIELNDEGFELIHELITMERL